MSVQAHHSFKGYTGLPGRKLQQGPPELPAEAQPAVPEMIEPFAAMSPSAEAPMTAPGRVSSCTHSCIPFRCILYYLTLLFSVRQGLKY